MEVTATVYAILNANMDYEMRTFKIIGLKYNENETLLVTPDGEVWSKPVAISVNGEIIWQEEV
jgi:hypothetical protein